MKLILTALAFVLLVSLASAGFLHGGWSAPTYRRVVYVAPSYSSGWSGNSYGGWSGGWSGKGYSGWGGWNKGWSSGWW